MIALNDIFSNPYSNWNMMNKTEIIKVENLSTSFGENIVHKDISFSVKEGEIFGVLGGSGSGKKCTCKTNRDVG